MLFKKDQTLVIDQMIKAVKSNLAHVVGSAADTAQPLQEKRLKLLTLIKIIPLSSEDLCPLTYKIDVFL